MTENQEFKTSHRLTQMKEDEGKVGNWRDWGDFLRVKQRNYRIFVENWLIGRATGV